MQILRKDDCLGIAEVAGGTATSVELLAAEDFSYALAQGEEISVKLPSAGFVYAPVSEGQHAGYAHIFVDHSPVGKVPLCYGAAVERTQESPKTWLDKLLRW